MKTKLTLGGLTILVLAISCKDHSTLQTAESVETYIALLRSNQYDSIMLPAFTPQDIPALLAYRNDTQVISEFPQNPISSLHMTQCTVGMYALWTIESIRQVSLNKALILRFPSQNPILRLRHSDELVMVADNTTQMIAANAYYEWWKSNEHNDFNSFKNIDPLLTTNYTWH